MITFDEAIAQIAGIAKPLGTQIVRLDEAAGRTLARDIVASIDSPRTDVSAMDGFAVRDAGLSSVPARLRVTGQSFAGHQEPPALGSNECVRVFTGGAIPKGGDRVVIQEAVREEGEWAWFDDLPGPARHLRARASDFSRGDTLLCSGSLLGPRALVAAAAADVATLEAYRQPRLAILSTGDELAAPGTARDQPARIPESLALAVAAMGEVWGGSCVSRLRESDDPVRLQQAAEKALEAADLLIVTGGASVGERDYAKAMFEDELDLIFSKVAIKPGKPVWLGRRRGRLVLGLPGNPTSAMVTARLFLAPLVAGLSGRDPGSALCWRSAELAGPLAAAGDRETFVRARWSGQLVEALADQDSGAQRALVAADILLRRRPRALAAVAGQAVDALDF